MIRHKRFVTLKSCVASGGFSAMLMIVRAEDLSYLPANVQAFLWVFVNSLPVFV